MSFDKYGEKLIDTAAKTVLRRCKSCFKKIVNKTAEATGKLIRNKITDKIVKPKPISDTKSSDVVEIIL